VGQLAGTGGVGMSMDGYYNDSYDPYAEESAQSPYASMFFTPEQLAMQQAMLGGGAMGSGISPDILMQLFGGASLPQLDTKGREQPYDLGLAQQLMNYGQDMASSYTNPALAYAGGAGSYAPGALNPTREEEVLQLTQGPQLRMLSQSGGIQGTLADLILGGMNAGQAAARVRAMLEKPEEFADVITPEEAASMRGELQLTQASDFADPTPDFNSINTIADKIYSPYLQEQAMLQQSDVEVDPLTGRAVRVSERDSPTMEFLKKAGLPDPRARYDVEFALQNDPTLMTLLRTQAGSQQERDMMRGEYDARLKRMQKRRDQKEQDAAEMEKYASATKQAMADYFGETGRGGRSAASPGAGPGSGGYNPSGFVPEGWGGGKPAGFDPSSFIPGGWGGDRAASPSSPEGGGDGGGNFLSGLADRVVSQGRGMVDPLGVLGKGRAVVDPLGVLGKGRAALGGIFGGGNEGPAGPNLPSKPAQGEQYSLMEQLLGKPIRDRKQAMVDEAVPLKLQRLALQQKRRGLEGVGTEAAWKYAMRLAPIINAARRGQTPAGDAVQQRLAPLYAMGAINSQRGF